MPVLYNGQKIRPVQTVTFSREAQEAGDGRKLGTTVRAVVAGTICPDMPDGVLVPLTTDARLSTILADQAALRNLFAVDGGVFEVQGWDGAVDTRFAARVVEGPVFEPGPWINKCEYTITLESTEFSGEGAGLTHVSSASESWSFENGEVPGTTAVRHTVSAKGQTVYDPTGAVPKKAWEYARDFCQGSLGLGFATTTSAYWSPLSGSDLAAASAALPSASNAWNHAVVETVDETEGSYEAAESWLIAPAGYTEDYTVSVRRVTDQPAMTTSVSVQGVVTGLTPSQNDFAGRFANALVGWSAVQALLAGRAQGATSATLVAHPFELSHDQNYNAGTVSYASEWNDRVLVNDTYEVYSVSPQASLEDYRTAATVEGTVYGVFYADTDADASVRLTRAQAQYDRVKGMMLARAVNATGATGLKAFPVSSRYTPNPSEGSVSYSFEFDDRDPETVRDEFTVSSHFSRDDGIRTVAVEGTVTGLRAANSSSPFGTGDRHERYQLAVAYYDGKKDGMLSLASLYLGTSDLYSVPKTVSESHNDLGGSVSYAYEFTNVQGPLTPGALSESIQISEDSAVPVIAILPVLDDPSGPIVQRMATVKESRRTLSLEVVFGPPANPALAINPPAVDVSIYAPVGREVYLEHDQPTWSPNLGRYSRSTQWVYIK